MIIFCLLFSLGVSFWDLWFCWSRCFLSLLQSILGKWTKQSFDFLGLIKKGEINKNSDDFNLHKCSVIAYCLLARHRARNVLKLLQRLICLSYNLMLLKFNFFQPLFLFLLNPYIFSFLLLFCFLIFSRRVSVKSPS